MTQSCKNCKHAKFTRTPSGRISTKHAGECLAPSPVMGVQPSSMVVRVTRFCIWTDDGMTCPAWMPRRT